MSKYQKFNYANDEKEDTPKTPEKIDSPQLRFGRSFHHKGEESDYSFTEIAERMQEHGIVMNNRFGYYVQARIKIRRGVKIETPKGLGKIIFEKIPKTGGYHIIPKVIRINPQTSQK